MQKLSICGLNQFMLGYEKQLTKTIHINNLEITNNTIKICVPHDKLNCYALPLLSVLSDGVIE